MAKTDNKKLSSVRVVTDNMSSHPHCAHGPSLMFIRNGQKFFACSAYRDRKFCKFYMLEKDFKKRSKQLSHTTRKKYTNHDETFNEFIKMKLTQQCDRSYCHSCSIFFNSSIDKSHVDHDTINDLNFEQILNPSKFLKPIEDNQKEAQYLFSNESVNTIINILTENNIKNIICVGTPRIHEYAKANLRIKNVASFLLDIDIRHYNFNTTHEFCQYNMFNHHFFDEEKTNYNEFLENSRCDNICIVMDPPFGGRMEPLARTLQEVSKDFYQVHKIDSEKLLPTILVMPYFMEPHIKNHIPSLKMADYQVSYENHTNFQNGKNVKSGSPVRFFTSILMEKFTLPTAEGYTFCKLCSRWIGSWNRHCSRCGNCTSKNGTPYLHCEKCNSCVKSTWNHCARCSRCCLKDHECGSFVYNQECFHCKKFGHKKSNCPQLRQIDMT